jgi:CDP-2,3-bis-(O-geranylgeranyl)-sn-glycerol synthase
MQVEWWLAEFIFAWWVLLPAYAANMAPTVSGGKTPIDGGRMWFDKRRILGDHKTWKGFITGVVAGGFVGLLELWFQPNLNAFGAAWGITLPTMTVAAALAIPLGTMLGDLGGSFIKRRLGLQSGADAPFLDQLNFIVGAIALAWWLIPISPWMLLVMLVVTPILHRAANIVGYKLKVKRVPW